MAKQTQQMPVLRAHARFSWTPRSTAGSPSTPPAVSPSAPIEFIVGLYSDGSVNIEAPAPHGSLVSGLEWTDADEVIKPHGVRWSAANTWDRDTRDELIAAASNALRRQMGLAPQAETPKPLGSR